VKCRKSLQYFSEYGHKQQEELLRRQEQMQGLHDRLMENSKTILSAQVCNYSFWALNPYTHASLIIFLIKNIYLYFISTYIL